MKTPQEGGRATDGPHAGKVLAYDKFMMPVYRDGQRIGCYHWNDGAWLFEDEGPPEPSTYLDRLGEWQTGCRDRECGEE